MNHQRMLCIVSAATAALLLVIKDLWSRLREPAPPDDASSAVIRGRRAICANNPYKNAANGTFIELNKAAKEWLANKEMYHH